MAFVDALEPRRLMSTAAVAAANLSTPTLCAEDDNVNVPLTVAKPSHHVSFTLEARHPAYAVGVDNTAANFCNCDQAPTVYKGPPQTVHLYDDHRGTALEVVIDPNFYRPGMEVRVGKQSVAGVTYVRLIRQIAGTDSYPQVLVMYADGNLRLKPQAAVDGTDPAFGSSVIVGPAAEQARPFAAVKSITYVPASDTFKVVYAQGGGSATLRVLEADRLVTRVRVNGNYAATPTLPFATFRSMFVQTANDDVDHVSWSNGALGEDSAILSFRGAASARRFIFRRDVRSEHNTSAPDIVVGNFSV
jgi:hypothetical protein